MVYNVGKGHEIFAAVTGGRPLRFSRLINGGSRSPRVVGGMRRGQESPADKS